MRLTRGRFVRNDIWREGTWVDLWSVVHVLSGCSFGFGVSLFQFGTTASIIITFISFVAYELWEAMVKIVETPQNRCMDVVVGMVSFLAVFLFLVPVLPRPQLLFVFSVVLTTTIVMSVIGWRESQKAIVLEHRLRLEFAEQQRKFRERRARRLDRRRLRRIQ